LKKDGTVHEIIQKDKLNAQGYRYILSYYEKTGDLSSFYDDEGQGHTQLALGVVMNRIRSLWLGREPKTGVDVLAIRYLDEGKDNFDEGDERVLLLPSRSLAGICVTI
jgi:hypothetical protein